LGGGPLSPDEALEVYFSGLSVSRVESSRVVVVEYVAGDPDLAAEIANAVTAEYLLLQAEARRAAAGEDVETLAAEIAALEAGLAAAEAAVSDYRARNGLVASGAGMSIAQQRLAELLAEQSAGEAALAETEARAALLAGLLAAGASLEAAGSVLDTPSM